MPAPLLLDLSHTSHTRARTGIQRVVRSLRRALGTDAAPITFDPYQHAWRPLQRWETETLTAAAPARKRSARWPLAARLGGRFRRWTAAPAPLPANRGLIVPELFSPAVARRLPDLFTAVQGPRAALFHDAIALKLPEMAPTKTVARYPGYLRELLQFDGIAAISEDSRQTLLEYWRWLGVHEVPVVELIPLGIDAVPPALPAEAPGDEHLTVLSLGSIEGRKNHLALLAAAEALWSRGRRFTLHLIGLANAETGGAALAKIAALQAAGRPLRYDGPVDDAAVETAYRQCAFTVYPSLMEGFGLPVLESLAHGKPCICSGRGALGESARAGGCVTVEDVSDTMLAAAIDRLLTDGAELTRLAAEARARTFRTWADYAADLTGWMATLARFGGRAGHP